MRAVRSSISASSLRIDAGTSRERRPGSLLGAETFWTALTISELRAQPRDRGVPARARGGRVVLVGLARIGVAAAGAGLRPHVERDLLGAQPPLELHGVAARRAGALPCEHHE